MFNETIITVVGNLVADPNFRRTKNGHAVANLRVASTPRRRDRDSGEWVDSETLFVTVTCWRKLAENVDTSMKKGDPVVVTGRLYSREYEVDESKRMTYELEATAIGHDLSRGVAKFQRVSRPDAIVQVPLGEDGVPADESEHYLDLQTGEILDRASAADAGSDERELVAAG